MRANAVIFEITKQLKENNEVALFLFELHRELKQRTYHQRKCDREDEWRRASRPEKKRPPLRPVRSETARASNENTSNKKLRVF